jgi:aspartate racemase
MRYLGLLGGMSWESTAAYYRLINCGVAARCGDLHSAPLLIHSFDFATVAALQQRGAWAEAGRLLAEAALGLERAGATAVALCTNTMHCVAPAVEAELSVPFLHIVDPTGRALQGASVTRAGLLGTRYTMEQPFWKARLAERFNVDLVTPEEAERELIHRVIYEELCRGRIEPTSRVACLAIMSRLAATGAEAIILGCTELGLLIDPDDAPLPTFDTTVLHCDTAVAFIVGP